jgi:two-component system, repressor protein LuxO
MHSIKTTSNASILVVEDNTDIIRLYQEFLRAESYQLAIAETGAAALAALQAHPPCVVLLDLGLPDMDGLEILDFIQRHKLPSSVVVVSAHGSVSAAVQAMRGGAFDFIEKPFNQERLRVTVRNALEKQHLAALVQAYAAHERQGYEGFLGQSLPMQSLYRTIDSAAASKATAFITGESGTGKELCAEAIHNQSPRRDKAFVVLNCAAIPRELMESEIFGHVKGAFTGAHIARNGAARRAHEGTLFLDEICEMDLNLQSKLLRFIQSSTFTKVGSDTPEQVDIRIICATNRDPEKEVEAGRFREDLYYRLHVIPIHIPPLRERGRDILLIAEKFLHEFSAEENKAFRGFAPVVEELFKHYAWPGNVRELQNIIRNIVVLHNGRSVTLEMLPPQFKKRKHSDIAAPGVDKPKIPPLWQVEKQAIETALEQCQGNVPKAAALLEVSPSTLYRKLKQWEEHAA